MKVFAAIDVGSYELSMKIFEFTEKNGMREIDHIRHKLDLGSETYSAGKLSTEKVDELCRVLKEYKDILTGYKVDAYKAYGTSAIREMENRDIVIEQIAQTTGIRIEVLSNSEQRFLNYKSVAAKGEAFDRLLDKGTLFLDIGGGSIHVLQKDTATILGLFHTSPGCARIGSIEGDNIELENVEAEIVRGKYVRIGHGCRIGTVEYGENLEAEPGTVGHSTQTGTK